MIWWTGFPTAFAAAMTTLFVPLVLALAGIVLRGASFAFCKYAETFSQARLFGAIFAGLYPTASLSTLSVHGTTK